MAAIEAQAADTTAEARPAAAAAWWMLAILFLFYVIAFIDRLALSVMIEPIRNDLNLSDFQMSLLLGPAFGVFYALFGIPLGMAADRFDRRWVIFLGMVVWSIATAASSLADNFFTLFLSRAFTAIGEATLVPAAYSLLADAFQKRQLTTAMAIFTAGYKAGVAASFTVAALALSAAAAIRAAYPEVAIHSDWQIAFVLIGGPGLILSFLVFTFREPPRRGAGRAAKKKGNLWGYLRDRADINVPLIIAVTVLSMVSSALSSWSPTFLNRVHGWAPLEFAPALSLISLLSVGAVVIKGSIMDWLFASGMKDAHVRFYTWVLTAGLPIGCVAFLIPWPWVFLPVLGIIQAVVLPFMVYFIATVQLAGPPELRGQLTGLYFGIGALAGAAFGPPLVGALNDFVFGDPAKIGWSMTILMVCGLTIALISLRILLPKLKPAIEEQEAAERAAAG